MADSVVVNGVTLTRVQIEDALERLNRPDIRPGDIVRVEARQRVLVIADLSDTAKILRKHYAGHIASDRPIMIGLDGLVGQCFDPLLKYVTKIANIKDLIG